MKNTQEVRLSPEAPEEEEPFLVTQEREAINGRMVVFVGFVGCLLVVGSAVIAGLMLRARTGSIIAGAANGPAGGDAPREISGVPQSLFESAAHGRAVEEEQRRALDGFGWVDRDAGVARIPIDRAIELLVGQEDR